MSKISEVVNKNIEDKTWLLKMLPFSSNPAVYFIVIKKYHLEDPEFLIKLLSLKKDSLKKEYIYYIEDLKGNNIKLVDFFEKMCLHELSESSESVEQSETSEIKSPASETNSTETYYY